MKILFLISSALLLVCAAASAHADSVTYTVSVNTSSASSQSGYIDLEFNAGSLPSSALTATVTGFTGATLNSSDSANDAIGTTGSLPGPLVFDNQTGNDYFEALTFGDSLSFLVTISGPGLTTAGQSGTDFQLSFLDSSQTSYLLGSDPSALGSALIEVGADGTVALGDQPNVTAAAVPAATPEPSTLSLLGLGGVLLGTVRRWRPRSA